MKLVLLIAIISLNAISGIRVIPTREGGGGIGNPEGTIEREGGNGIGNPGGFVRPAGHPFLPYSFDLFEYGLHKTGYINLRQTRQSALEYRRMLGSMYHREIADILENLIAELADRPELRRRLIDGVRLHSVFVDAGRELQVDLDVLPDQGSFVVLGERHRIERVVYVNSDLVHEILGRPHHEKWLNLSAFVVHELLGFSFFDEGDEDSKRTMLVTALLFAPSHRAHWLERAEELAQNPSLYDSVRSEFRQVFLTGNR